MTLSSSKMLVLALGATVSLGAGFAAAGGSGSSAAGPLRCEIVAASSGGMTSIEAVALAERALSGSYQLKISGPGANISQGGEFDIASGRKTTLGSAMLGGGRGYDVRLEVSAGGKTVSCSQRV